MREVMVVDRRVDKYEREITREHALKDLASAGLPAEALQEGIEVEIVSGSNESVCILQRCERYYRIHRRW